MSYDVFDIANKILHKGVNSDGGELITNLKLQKLLYYMQGFHLAYFGEPLFENELEAWQYGPVVPEVYRYFKENGNSGIIPKEDVKILLDEEESLFEEVFAVYGEFSAIGLMNLTHSEAPWLNTPMNGVIDKKAMEVFFKTRLS